VEVCRNCYKLWKFVEFVQVVEIFTTLMASPQSSSSSTPAPPHPPAQDHVRMIKELEERLELYKRTSAYATAEDVTEETMRRSLDRLARLRTVFKHCGFQSLEAALFCSTACFLYDEKFDETLNELGVFEYDTAIGRLEKDQKSTMGHLGLATTHYSLMCARLVEAELQKELEGLAEEALATQNAQEKAKDKLLNAVKEIDQALLHLGHFGVGLKNVRITLEAEAAQMPVPVPDTHMTQKPNFNFESAAAGSIVPPSGPGPATPSQPQSAASAAATPVYPESVSSTSLQPGSAAASAAICNATTTYLQVKDNRTNILINLYGQEKRFKGIKGQKPPIGAFAIDDKYSIWNEGTSRYFVFLSGTVPDHLVDKAAEQMFDPMTISEFKKFAEENVSKAEEIEKTMTFIKKPGEKVGFFTEPRKSKKKEVKKRDSARKKKKQKTVKPSSSEEEDDDEEEEDEDD